MKRPGFALRGFLFVLLVLTTTTPNHSTTAFASTPDEVFIHSAFKRVWTNTDLPIATGQVTDSSWLWGPSGKEYRFETYKESPGGTRLVQYFDKARMEIRDPLKSKTDPFYVENGLLTKELVSGQIQIGDTTFNTSPTGPASISVAGDLDDVNGPTYLTFQNIATLSYGDNRSFPRQNQSVTGAIDRTGQLFPASQNLSGKAQYVSYIQQTGHNIPDVFWQWLNRLPANWVGVMGLPITEAYWARVKVGGQMRDILIQLYERRVLTYTPSNSDPYKIEMGNIGQHYYQWRYKSGFGAGKSFTAPDRSQGTVTNVVDGDTADVQLSTGGKKRLRFIGVDTPETVKPDTPVQCFGPEASNYTKVKLTGKQVELERDLGDLDKYGRTLRHIYLDGMNFDYQLIAFGYGRAAPYSDTPRLAVWYSEAEADARTVGRGLWSACNTPTPSSTPTAGIQFVSVEGGPPGGTAKVEVQTGAQLECTILYTTPSGTVSQAQGLEKKTSSTDGRVLWSWKIGSSTRPGTGTVKVTCNGESVTSPITIG